ncbi:MAG: hypothetical protein NVS3B21_34440 [Acidimicrobiales bacterium]
MGGMGRCTAGFFDRGSIGVKAEQQSSGVQAGVAALGCAAFVVGALAAEVVGGLGANSPVPSEAERAFPISWPQPVRVVWWLAVSAAALGYRVMMGRLGIPQRRGVVAASVLPFVIFATGIAAGADWATWH